MLLAGDLDLDIDPPFIQRSLVYSPIYSDIFVFAAKLLVRMTQTFQNRWEYSKDHWINEGEGSRSRSRSPTSDI